MATSSIMFMRIVGNSVGVAVFGAILNFGINRRIPEAGDAVNRLLEPAARHGLGAAEIDRLSEAVAGSLHVIYVVAGLVAVVSLLLALALRRGSARPGQSRGLDKSFYCPARRRLPFGSYCRTSNEPSA
jgi:hypothetical protein